MKRSDGAIYTKGHKVNCNCQICGTLWYLQASLEKLKLFFRTREMT